MGDDIAKVVETLQQAVSQGGCVPMFVLSADQSRDISERWEASLTEDATRFCWAGKGATVGAAIDALIRAVRKWVEGEVAEVAISVKAMASLSGMAPE